MTDVSDFLEIIDNMINKILLLDVSTDGIVINESEALTSPCKCFEYEIKGEKRWFCWVPGVVGALSREQVERFCKEPYEKGKKEIIWLKGKALPERVEKFIEASEQCENMSLEERIACMARELEKRGIRL